MKGLLDASVVVATVDRPASLARCLDGLFAGEAIPREVIVADQSPSGGTQAVVDERARMGLPVVRMALSKRGAAMARNAGARRARQPTIVFTDDDCLPDRRCLGELLAALERPGHPAAATGRVLPLGPPAPHRHAVATRDSRRGADHKGAVLPWRAGTGGSIAIRREWLESVGGWDERLGPGTAAEAAEDIDLIRRLLRAGATIRYEPKAVVFHERQDDRTFQGSRRRYGFGMGAAAGLWLREGDTTAPVFLGVWLAERTRMLIAAVWRGRWHAAGSEARMLVAAGSGLRHGLLAAGGPAPVRLTYPGRPHGS